MEIERKGNVMFYTNYRNYFISAICMPNGEYAELVSIIHNWKAVVKFVQIIFRFPST